MCIRDRYVALGILETFSAVLAASKLSDSPALAYQRHHMLNLAGSTFMGLRDLSLVDASLVRDIGSYVGDSDGQGSFESTSHLQLVLSPQQDDERLRKLRPPQMHREKREDNNNQQAKSALEEITPHRIPTAE